MLKSFFKREYAKIGRLPLIYDLHYYKMNKFNRYDLLIIIIISVLCFGHIASPLYPSRSLLLLLAPSILNELRKIYIPKYVKTFFYVWIFLGLISLLWSYDRISGIKEVLYHLCNVIGFFSIYVYSLKAKKSVSSILLGWSIFCALTFPIAIFEIVTGFHLPMSVHDENTRITSIDGISIQRIFASVTFGNLNNYNVVLCYSLIFILSSLLYYRKKIFLSITWVIVGILIFVLITNASRGATICLAISIILLFFHMIRKLKKNLFFTICLFSIAIYLIWTNFDSFSSQIVGRFIDHSLEDTSRNNLYEGCFNILTMTGGLGVGIGGVSASMMKHYPHMVNNPHNMFLEFLLEFGIIPFYFYLRMLFKLVIDMYRCHSLVTNYLSKVVTIIAIPLFIINSSYIRETSLWIFFGSLFAISMCYKFNNKLKTYA